MAPGAEAAARAAAARQVGVAAQAVPETYGKPESRAQRLVAVLVAAELVQVARAGEAEMAAVVRVGRAPAAAADRVVAVAESVAAADWVVAEAVPEAEPAVGQVPRLSRAGG